MVTPQENYQILMKIQTDNIKLQLHLPMKYDVFILSVFIS